MSQPNLYISNSKADSRDRLTRRGRVALWLVVWLVVFDVLINLVFGFPQDPKVQPSRLQLYFNYGRSQEGKLAQITRPNPNETAPITLSGWYDPIQAQELAGDPGAPEITFYGMSHAVRLAHALARVSNQFRVRIVAAPGATTNWAYGAYLRDRGGGKSKAVVLAFMSGNVPMINTMTALTWNTNVAIPYTADRFFLKDGDLARRTPPFSSFKGFIRAFYNADDWSVARKEFSAWDQYYDGFVMHGDLLDRSAYVRLVRRAYAQHEQREIRQSVIAGGSIDSQSEQIQVARAIVKQFASDARRQHLIPVVFIANLLGDSNYVFRALEPVLREDRVPFLSSDSVVSPSDPTKYLPDTHFTDTTDDQLAAALAQILARQLSRDGK